MDATVYLDTHAHVGTIDRRIFGGFLEHLGRAVYQGVYDPESPTTPGNVPRRWSRWRRNVVWRMAICRSIFRHLVFAPCRWPPPGAKFVAEMKRYLKKRHLPWCAVT